VGLSLQRDAATAAPMAAAAAFTPNICVGRLPLKIAASAPPLEERPGAHKFWLSLTPGFAPLVNSMPAASSARWIAALVDLFGELFSVSKLLTVAGLTPAFSARARTDHCNIARAARHCAAVIVMPRAIRDSLRLSYMS
jgi:hypothetical protein